MNFFQKYKFQLFILAVFVMNILQSISVDLTGDEALYWMYSKNMDWGSRDHPPMIAALIWFGTKIFSGELGVRFFIALCNALTLWFTYSLVKPIALWKFALVVLARPSKNFC